MEVMEDKEDKETYGEDPVETEVQVETEVFTVVMVETEGGVAMEGRYLAEVVEEDAVVVVKPLIEIAVKSLIEVKVRVKVLD
ncbi:hypothetical protein BGX29_005876 [Mortierella sp. GBA35]|nr:hypothetical protein BGX29_005876 [Mortierella sp. GBA35]